MFDEIFRVLKRLESGTRIQVTLPLDEEKYLDRICPSEVCQSEFKVFIQDWREKVADEEVYCPICRYESPSTDWNTKEQAEYIRKVAESYVQKVVHSALTEDVRRFNRTQQVGFVKISMTLKKETGPIIVPVEAANTMRQKFVCEVCGCRYASIGAAYFCPACGHNSVITTFNKTLEIVHQIVLKIPLMRSTLAAAYDIDIAQNSMRNILEDSLVRLVGAYQLYADALFDRLPNAISFKRRKNLFQNLSESSALWRSAVGKGYEDMLSPIELQEMESLFQKRHLVAHRNGIVDQEYIDKSGDKSFLVGQRLVIQESTVIHFTELLSKLADELCKIV